MVGQAHVVRTLRNAARRRTLAHAYLFAGPRGTGKTSMARLLFKAANCLSPDDGGSCERCAICVSANEGRAIDLVELDAASNRGIDDVRDLRDKIHYAPAEARFRVYILDEAHQLTQAAWDALLKTLEEPPPHAILVLATTEAHKVPATVVSRCQRFDFHRISAADIRGRLEKIAGQEGLTVEPAVLGWLARAARGGLRDAIGLLDQLRAFAGDQIDAASAREVLGLAGLEAVRAFLEALRDDRAADAVDELADALAHGVDPRVFLGDVVTYLRGLLLLRFGAGAALRDELAAEEIDWLEAQAAEWEAARLRDLVAGFSEAVARVRDPSQLVLQAELTLLGHAAVPDPPPQRSPKRLAEGPAAAAAPPARAFAPDPGPPSDRSAEAVGAASPAPPPSDPEPPPPVAIATGDRQDRSDVAAGSPTTAPLELAVVRHVWPAIRGHVAGTSAGWLWFNQCELQDVDGDTLVLRLDGGLRAFLEGERRRPLERELATAMGRTVRVRMVDDPPSAGEDSAGDDPVIRAGLKLFGGPLEPLEEPS